jgi:photosystem II stability/assembly factor-like uncharacterized protein
MKNKIKYLYILFLSFFFHLILLNTSFSQWMPTGGPTGGDIQCVTKSQNTLLAGGWGNGIFRSIDNGNNWEYLVNFPKYKYIYCINSFWNKVFAGIGGGYYYTTNNGDNWSLVDSLFNNYTVYEQTFLDSSVFVCVGSNNSGNVFYSSNYGNNWSSVGTGLPISYLSPKHITNSGGNIIVGFCNGLSEQGIYLSTNRGLNWSNAYQNYIYSLASSGNIVIAGVHKGVVISTNNGVNWTVVTGWTPEHNYISSIAFKGSSIYASTFLNSYVYTNSGIYKSTDNGYTWTMVYNNPRDTININAVLASDSNIFACTSNSVGPGGGMLRSNNNGSNWSYINSGISARNISSFAIRNNELYVSTLYGNGVYRSTDYGNNWIELNGDLPKYQVRHIAIKDSLLFVALPDGYGVYRSSNNGVNWVKKVNGMWDTNILTIMSYGAYLFAGTSANTFRSIDNGENWTSIAPTAYYGTAAFYQFGNKLFAGTMVGVYYSTNYGLNWSSNQLSCDVHAIYSIGSKLFVGTNGSGVFVSENSGLNWIQVNNGLTSLYVHSLASKDTLLFAGTSGGVFMTTNYGINWTCKSHNSLDWHINSIIILDNYIYEGTTIASVLKRSISDITEVNNYNNILPATFRLYQNYPNPFNPITKIRFELPSKDFVKLIVFDITGRIIEILINNELSSGVHEINWDASHYASGVYFYKIEASNFSETKKMILLK